MNEANAMQGRGRVYVVYTGILALALVQIVVAMQRGPSLVFMLLVAFLQAWLAVSYFMHLRDERPSLVLALIPYTLFVLLIERKPQSFTYSLNDKFFRVPNELGSLSGCKVNLLISLVPFICFFNLSSSTFSLP